MSLLAANPLPPSTTKQQHLWDEGPFATEAELVAAALALGAGEVKPWSQPEIALARASRKAHAVANSKLTVLRDLIHSGADPLGQAFCTLRSPVERA